MEDFGKLTRRTLLAAAAVVAITAPSLAPRAIAAESETEKANVKVVNDSCQLDLPVWAWGIGLGE